MVDVVSALTDSNDPAHYWRTLKSRMLQEGNETVTNCDTFKLKAKDGKMRNTDMLDTQNILRLIESIPSPKAEPFKMWLASLGNERIAKSEHPQGFNENMSVAKRGGQVANDARKSYEKQTKKSAISKDNALNYKYIEDEKLIEDKKSKKKK